MGRRRIQHVDTSLSHNGGQGESAADMAPSWLTALRNNPVRSLGFILLAVILLSALNHPDPESDRFQLPGLLPSHSFGVATYPPGKAIYHSPQLTRLEEKRYAHLRHPVVPGSNRLDGKQGKYLFTTITRNIQDSLPDLLNTIVVLVEFLGADKVYFSILEGPSHDETPQVLEEVLRPMLLTLGVPPGHIIIRTHMPEIDFNKVNRIQALAELRNEALRPLWSGWSDTAAVIFFNDVYMKASDVLELLHQHVKAGQKLDKETGITTGMDWWKKKPQYYYDVWVGRTVSTALVPIHEVLTEGTARRGTLLPEPVDVVVTLGRPLPDRPERQIQLRGAADFPGLLVMEWDGRAGCDSVPAT